MMRLSLKPYVILGWLIAGCLAITAAAGLWVKDIYAPFIHSDALIAGQVVQDAISLLAAPAIIVAMRYAQRGSRRAFALWGGILVYTVYYYSFYAFDKVYTGVYPFYLALLGLGVYSLIGLLVSVDMDAYARGADARMPVRWIAAVLATALLFIPIWGAALQHDISLQQPRTQATVFVLDLCFLIPAMTLAAVQLWRRKPLGYTLAGMLLFKAAVSGWLLTFASLRCMQFGYPTAPEEMGMYIFLLAAGTAGLGLYLRHIHGGEIRSWADSHVAGEGVKA